MKNRKADWVIAINMAVLSACSSVPTVVGPSVLVLPGAGKPFDQFKSEDFRCQQYASTQIRGITPDKPSVASGVGNANSMDVEPVQSSGLEAQSRYDMGYIQCMYSMGNRVPISGNLIDENMYEDNSPANHAPETPPSSR